MSTGAMMQQGAAAVEVQNTSGGKIIRIRQADGTERRIEVSADGQVSMSGAAPGEAVAQEPAREGSRDRVPSDGLIPLMGIIFSAVTMMTLGTPLVKAWARRFEKRAELQQQAQIEQRLAAIEQAIETVAVEVERISEGQRFTTKLLADRTPVELERVQ